MLTCGFCLLQNKPFTKKSVIRFILIFLLSIKHVNSSLLIGKLSTNIKATSIQLSFHRNDPIFLGALFGADTVKNGSHMVESDEEIVFKHAVYISNQYKISYLNEPSHHSTLLHTIIHIPRLEQVHTIKKGNH